jgi:hypothetical protein
MKMTVLYCILGKFISQTFELLIGVRLTGVLSKRRDAELLDILSRWWDVHILIPFRR